MSNVCTCGSERRYDKLRYSLDQGTLRQDAGHLTGCAGCTTEFVEALDKYLSSHTRFHFTTISSGGPPAQLLQSYLSEYDRAYLSALRQLTSACESITPDWILIKGVALDCYYQSFSRDYWDIDVYVPDFFECMNICRRLILDGAVLHDISVKPFHRGTFGWKVHLFGRNGIPIEFHVGPFQGYARNVIDCDPLEDAQLVQVKGVECRVPAPEISLVYTAAHAYRNGRLRSKDTRDASMLLASGTMDLDKAISIGRRCGYLTVLELLISCAGSKAKSPGGKLQVFGRSIAARLFSYQRGDESESFQLLALLAQATCISNGKTYYGSLTALRDVRDRVMFGLSHSRWIDKQITSRLSNSLLAKSCEQPFSPFGTGYYYPIFPRDEIFLTATAAWKKLFETTDYPPDSKIFAQYLISLKVNDQECIVATPLGIMSNHSTGTAPNIEDRNRLLTHLITLS